MLDPEKEINLQDEVEFTVVEVWLGIDVSISCCCLKSLLFQIHVKRQIALIIDLYKKVIHNTIPY